MKAQPTTTYAISQKALRKCIDEAFAAGYAACQQQASGRLSQDRQTYVDRTTTRLGKLLRVLPIRKSGKKSG